MNANSNQKLIVVAGGTGDLGGHIARYLLQYGAIPKVLIRKETHQMRPLDEAILVSPVDYNDHDSLRDACAGAACVISALSGLGDVIVDTQLRLLHAAVDAGVPRFFPSDYCIDFRKLEPGSNRNLDFRREFYERSQDTPIRLTSVLNGMFMDLLNGQAPIIVPGLSRVVYWGSDESEMDFTTRADTANFTALAALDDDTPRFLCISGEEANVKGLRQSASQAFSKEFKEFRAGSLDLLKAMINVSRMFSPGKNEVYPAWQGMQYLHNMLTGLPKLIQLDNARYPQIKWTSIREQLALA